MKAPLAAALLSAALLPAACSSLEGPPGKAEPERRRALFERMRDKLDASWSKPSELPEYLEFFGLREPGTDAAASVAAANGRRVFALRLRPPEVRGRALVVHGYLAHSGHFLETARALLRDGWEVRLLDLPGFGLSDGARNTVADFREYGDAVAAVAAGMERGLPTLAVGHSTGCAALADFLLRGSAEAAAFDRLVFAAPLARTTAWKLVSRGAELAGERVVRFPRVPVASRGTIGNPAYLDLVGRDPLFAPVFDPGWVRALERWNERIDRAAPVSPPVPPLILQGGRDDVVDADYNLPAYRRLFPGARTLRFPECSHTILNETPERLEPALAALLAFAGGRGP